MSKKLSGNSVLIVEDNDTMREGMIRVVEKMGHKAIAFPDAESALSKIAQHQSQLIITDYKLPGKNGIELLKTIKEESPQSEVLMITAYGTIDLAVEAVKSGAADFITKPFPPEELTLKIEKLLERVRDKERLNRIADENIYLREQLEGTFNYGEIVGQSDVMQKIYRTIEKVARGDSSVIVYGESGTGKELVARAIHKASPRAERPFVRVHCGALAEGVLESELFGHEKGAFTGALKRRKGRFELAEGGSIFLDEIGDISPATQVKLLRVLQEKEIERVGSEETLTVDVRIIAATNKNLQEEIEKGNFREDLYYRLHIIPIELPPLRARKEDIAPLIEHFILKIARELNRPGLTITSDAVQKLQNYHWPGNVRELENILERAAVLCEENEITAADLPLLEEKAFPKSSVSSGVGLDLNESLENLERRLLEKAMAEADGVKTDAAKRLGIKTSALYYKLEKYDLL